MVRVLCCKCEGVLRKCETAYGINLGEMRLLNHFALATATHGTSSFVAHTCKAVFGFMPSLFTEINEKGRANERCECNCK